MPKQRITKDLVADIAFELARRYGMVKVRVKSITEKPSYSKQAGSKSLLPTIIYFPYSKHFCST